MAGPSKYLQHRTYHYSDTDTLITNSRYASSRWIGYYTTRHSLTHLLDHPRNHSKDPPTLDQHRPHVSPSIPVDPLSSHLTISHSFTSNKNAHHYPPPHSSTPSPREAPSPRFYRSSTTSCCCQDRREGWGCI